MGLLDKLFGPPKPDRFARLLIAALENAGETRHIDYDPDAFTLQFRGPDDKEGGTAFLGNFYAEYCKEKRKERPARLKHIVRGLLSVYKDMPEEFEDVCPDLRPIIRSRGYLEFTSLQMEVDDDKIMPHQLVGDHLVATVVFDLPEAMRSISQDNLESWGQSFYEVMEAARANLEETDFAFASIGDCLYASATGDNYDASRLLMLDLIRSFKVKGEVIALVANRDRLLVTGADDEEGLGLMATLAEESLKEPRPISAIPVRLDGDEWVTWLPAPGHPHFGKFRMLYLHTMASQYAEQKELLETWQEKRDIDRFVASFSVVEQKDGTLFSYSVWSKGVPTELPLTDKVIFFEEGKEVVASGDWDRVQEVVGHLMQAGVRYPPRWSVDEFPTDEQLARINA
ncbi:MAG: DUF1444 family protein [Gemmataceae bacterium]